MEITDFSIGAEFWMSGKPYRCTDIGTRTVVAICTQLPLTIVTSVNGRVSHEKIEAPLDAADWFSGPPYAVPEIVICSYDFPACHRQKEEGHANLP